MAHLAERRPAATLIVLLLLQGVLLSFQVRNERGQRLIRSWSLMAFTPIAAALDSAVTGLADGASAAQGLWQAHSENSRLEAENLRLRLEVARLRRLESLLPRLEPYRPLAREYGTRLVMGSVIWNDPPYFGRQIILNAGSRDQVAVDSAVVSALGVVGRVRETAPFSCWVELLTNPGASAGALLGPERLPGIVSGDGSPLLRMDFISNSKSVNIGDAVIASGTDRIYPKDFPVGTVVDSKPGPMGLLLIQVQPAADLMRLQEAAVILAVEPRPQGQAPGPADGS